VGAIARDVAASQLPGHHIVVGVHELPGPLVTLDLAEGVATGTGTFRIHLDGGEMVDVYLHRGGQRYVHTEFLDYMLDFEDALRESLTGILATLRRVLAGQSELVPYTARFPRRAQYTLPVANGDAWTFALIREIRLPWNSRTSVWGG
jgi:hypothetical protein